LSFFLGGQNRNFVKVRGQKLLLSLNYIRDAFSYTIMQKLNSQIIMLQTSRINNKHNTKITLGYMRVILKHKERRIKTT